MRRSKVLVTALVALGLVAPTAHATSAEAPPVPEPTENGHMRGQAGRGSLQDVFQPPEDVEQEDVSVPPGSIVVDLHDADDRPVTGEVVTLGALINSIAKGDTRKHFQATTDDRGRATFANLESASNIAYRVSSGYQGGSFAASPFQLPQGKALRVVLHVYDVARNIDAAVVVSQAVIAVELRDDRLQVEEALTIYNLGRTAWQPDDVRMLLPSGATGFGAQASMSDQGVDQVDSSARLRGTFPPGQHSIEFRWQLPWSGDANVDFGVGLPPHAAIARVLMPASSNVKLVAVGFPPADLRRDARGQSFLVTERRMRPDDPRLQSIDVGVHDLPTPGPGRLVATWLAVLAIGIGFFWSISRSRGSGKGATSEGFRASLLDELWALERARAAGDVGVRTYERARRELIDALAFAIAAGSHS